MKAILCASPCHLGGLQQLFNRDGGDGRAVRTNTVNFAVIGVPAGATATIGTNSISTDGTSTPGLIVQTTAALAQGTYDLAIVASEKASYRLPFADLQLYVERSGVHQRHLHKLESPWKLGGGAVPGAADAPSSGTSGHNQYHRQPDQSPHLRQRDGRLAALRSGAE